MFLSLPPPEPLFLLQAAAADTNSAGLDSLLQDLRCQNSRHVVMLRGRPRVFLLDNGELRNAFPVAIATASAVMPMTAEAWITIKGCTTTGFHGTPHRWTGDRPSLMAACGFTTRM